MDEEHRHARGAQALHRRGRLEGVAGAQQARRVGDVEDRKARQAEDVVQLQHELVPDARVAAVLHDQADVFREAAHAGGHHDLGAAHGDAKQDDARLGVARHDVVDPAQKVARVSPAHLDEARVDVALVAARGRHEHAHAQLGEVVGVLGHVRGLADVAVADHGPGVAVGVGGAIRTVELPAKKNRAVRCLVRDAALLGVEPGGRLLGVVLVELGGLGIVEPAHIALVDGVGHRDLGVRVERKVNEEVPGKAQANEHERDERRHDGQDSLGSSYQCHAVPSAPNAKLGAPFYP